MVKKRFNFTVPKNLIEHNFGFNKLRQHNLPSCQLIESTEFICKAGFPRILNVFPKMFDYFKADWFHFNLCIMYVYLDMNAMQIIYKKTEINPKFSKNKQQCIIKWHISKLIFYFFIITCYVVFCFWNTYHYYTEHTDTDIG